MADSADAVSVTTSTTVGRTRSDEDIVTLLLPHYTAGTAWIVDHHWPR